MSSFPLALLLAAVLLATTSAAPMPLRQAQQYLKQFGYLDDSSLTKFDSQLYRDAILDFQRFAGLQQTGRLDVATGKKMSEPRCGMKDRNGRPGRRFTALGSTWQKRDISYGIRQYGRKLTREQSDQAVQQALAAWAAHVDLNFMPSRNADIDIKFSGGSHDCSGGSFDGPGSVLAHAFSPGEGIGGDAHFDDDESWTMTGDRGTSILQVAAHEFGHSLGLGHSEHSSALMAPFYQSHGQLRMTEDDVRGIQSFYGAKKGASGPQHPGGGGNGLQFPGGGPNKGLNDRPKNRKRKWPRRPKWVPRLPWDGKSEPMKTKKRPK